MRSLAVDLINDGANGLDQLFVHFFTRYFQMYGLVLYWKFAPCHISLLPGLRRRMAQECGQSRQPAAGHMATHWHTQSIGMAHGRAPIKP